MNLAFQRIILSDIQILHNTLQGYEYCLSYQRHYSAYVQRRLDVYLRFNHFAKIPTLDKLFPSSVSLLRSITFHVKT